MKVITSDVKAKIFAQYIGQIFIHRFLTPAVVEPSDLLQVTYTTCSKIQEDHCLFSGIQVVLKSLQNISDEDAIEVAKYLNWGRDIIKRRLSGDIREDQNIDDLRQTYIRVGKESVMIFLGKLVPSVITSPLECANCFNFLQSKGYALPYMDYSVEDLVELGIYKLK